MNLPDNTHEKGPKEGESHTEALRQLKDSITQLELIGEQLIDWLPNAIAQSGTRVEPEVLRQRFEQLISQLDLVCVQEQELARQLIQARGKLTPELAFVQSNSRRAYRQLRGRLDRIFDELLAAAPGSSAWDTGVASLDLWIDAVEEYQEEEAESLESLVPTRIP